MLLFQYTKKNILFPHMFPVHIMKTIHCLQGYRVGREAIIDASWSVLLSPFNTMCAGGKIIIFTLRVGCISKWTQPLQFRASWLIGNVRPLCPIGRHCWGEPYIFANCTYSRVIGFPKSCSHKERAVQEL